MAVIEKCPWDFVDPPPNDYYCPMCGKVLDEPMLTNCCGSHFCKACIDPIFQNKELCPNSECGVKDYVCIVDKPMWKKILELDVICPLKGRGCNWIGEIGTRDKHLDSSEGDCEYIDVVCTRGCGEEMERYELAEHLEKFCHKRPFTCEHCGIENVYEIIINDHMPECPAHPVACPNNCGNDDITRSVYPHHLLECPEQEVVCDFSYAGCKAKVKRKGMAEHHRNDVYTHLSLQTAFASKQLAERDEKLREVSSQWEERFEELTKEMRQLQTEQEWMRTELRRKEMKIAELRGIHKLELYFTISTGRILTLKQADIATEDVDVIVNSYGSMGVAKALNDASNGSLQIYISEYLRTHNAANDSTFPFLTSAAGSLQCKQVIHTLGPSWWDEDECDDDSEQKETLKDCITGVLKCAEAESIYSLSLPAISAGGLGGDPKIVAEVIVDAILQYKYTKPYPVLSDIRIVILDETTHKPFAQYFKRKCARVVKFE